MKKLLSVLFILAFSTNSFAAPEDARKFVAGVGDEVLKIVKTSGQSAGEKEKALVDMFKSHVDTSWMSGFVLGKYNRTTPKDKLEKFKAVYGDFLIQSYVPKFRQYTGQEFKVVGARKGPGGNDYFVDTEINNGKDPAIKVVYRTIEKEGAQKIVDIVVEGVSLITTQRSEFGAVISNEGFDSLITRIEGRLKKMKSEKA